MSLKKLFELVLLSTFVHRRVVCRIVSVVVGMSCPCPATTERDAADDREDEDE